VPSVALNLPDAFRRALTAYESGQLADCERLCRAILGIARDHVDAIHLLGLVQYRCGLWNEALASYDRARAFAPENAALLNHRGNVLKQLQRSAEALASYDQALAIRPQYPEALNNRGVTLHDLGRFDEALASFEAALAIAPRDAEAHNNRGITLKAQNRFSEALASYDEALAIRPDYLQALNNRGNVLYEFKRFTEALASYESALAIRPDDADTLNHRGNILKALKRFDEALASYDRALTLAPNHVSAHCNRGITLHEIDRVEEALRSFAKALAIAPDHPDALCGRGNALKHLSRFVEAQASYERAIAVAPDHEFALGELADCALKQCDWDLQDRLAPDLRRRAIGGKSVINPMVLFGYGDDEALHLAGAKRFAAQRLGAAPQPLWDGAVWRNDRIKLAYLSADFRQHPVAELIVGMLERHDRSRFETIGISFGPDDGSAMRARIAAAFDQFHDVRAIGDCEAASLLHELRVDIAVDLTGYTLGYRQILARRPVPIAASYLGYPGTMGVDFIDYIIADRIIVPFDRAPCYSENIVHLPVSFMVNDSKREIAQAAPTRSEAGLPNDGIVFCCFNNHAKIAAPVFAAWMRLLQAVDGSVVWLSRASDAVIRNLRAATAAQGVDPARLVFAPRTARLADHLARHRLADMFLDTLPYNAHATASDALWAGLPVVTCRGNSLAGRVAASLLDATGLGDLVTHDLSQYEALALRLARDGAALASVKARLAQNRATSPLFDTDRFRRHIEAAYAMMWERWQRGERPRGFAVEPYRDVAETR
jgi:protein O-GlcNAc transferase